MSLLFDQDLSRRLPALLIGGEEGETWVAAAWARRASYDDVSEAGLPSDR